MFFCSTQLGIHSMKNRHMVDRRFHSPIRSHLNKFLSDKGIDDRTVFQVYSNGPEGIDSRFSGCQKFPDRNKIQPRMECNWRHLQPSTYLPCFQKL